MKGAASALVQRPLLGYPYKKREKGADMKAAVQEAETLLRCSFCGKDEHAIKYLIAGPAVHICNGCIGLCNDIIAKEEAKGQ